MIITPTNIRRSGDKITFSYYTNTQKNTLCKLMNKSGATRSNMMIMPAGRQEYSFLHVDPKREYLLQCLIGDDLSSSGGSFLDGSPVFTIPRDRNNYVWSMIRLLVVLLFIGSGIFALILLFKRPELFDVFFTPYLSRIPLSVVATTPRSSRFSTASRRAAAAPASWAAATGSATCVTASTAPTPTAPSVTSRAPSRPSTSPRASWRPRRPRRARSP